MRYGVNFHIGRVTKMITERDLQALHQAAQLIIDVVERQRIHNEDASERRAQFRFVPIGDSNGQKESPVGDNGAEGTKRGIIEFTNKEILSMPKEKRNYFRANGIRARWRKKKNGVFEIRCTIHGESFYGSAKDLATAKARFLEDLKREQKKETGAVMLPTFIKDYALHFLETFKKPNVGEKTYEHYLRLTKSYVIGTLGEKKICDVTASDCQKLLHKIVADGKGRTSEDVKNLMTWIFDGAAADKLIPVSPMKTVKIPKHRRVQGQCIPKNILSAVLGEPTCRYDYLILFMLYTGVRPAEIQSLKIKDGFVTVKNAKTPTGAPPTYRRFPLHSRLLPFAKEIESNANAHTDVLSRHFRKKIKGYRLYDLRHTFTTFIQECGANEKWVDYVTNHIGALNVTQKIYTHWSDDFQREQMEKLKF